jgi:integrase
VVLDNYWRVAGGIYKRGKTYWVWWTEPVKGADGEIRRKKFYASSESERQADAKTLLSTKVYQAQQRRPRRAENLTYEEIRDRWLAHRASKSKPRVLKNGVTYFAGRKYLDEYFRDWTAANIDTVDIELFQKKLRDKGLGNGIDRAVAALRAMLRFSSRQKDGLTPDQLPQHFPMLRIPRDEPKPIPEKFFVPLRDALPETYRSPFILAWHSGMRLSEIERLKWKHVDLKRKVLRFPGAKTGKVRSVPLLADTPAALGHPKQPEDLVFPAFSSTNETNRARAWRRAAVAVGCGHWCCRRCKARLENMKCPEHGVLSERYTEYVGPLFRHTRHTLIRRLTNRGVPTVRIMQMMGHENLPTNMGYNVAVEDEDLKLIRDRYL